jgi:sulfoxide reductase heme-binding subunit YedZ
MSAAPKVSSRIGSRKVNRLKVAIFVAALMPLTRLVWKAFTANLGANPIEVITRSTGTWTLVFLLITLSVTPLRKLTGMYGLIKFRRTLGLFAFFYAVLHFLTFVWLDKFFDFQEMIKDVVKRPFITAGFTAFVLMIPLALTSTSGMIRRLGGKRWQLLHRLIYVSGIAGVVHYVWLVKKDVRTPIIYACILGILLGYRLIVWITTASKRPTVFGGRPAQASES